MKTIQKFGLYELKWRLYKQPLLIIFPQGEEWEKWHEKTRSKFQRMLEWGWGNSIFLSVFLLRMLVLYYKYEFIINW